MHPKGKSALKKKMRETQVGFSKWNLKPKDGFLRGTCGLVGGKLWNIIKNWKVKTSYY